jgi:hypothetical protein
MVVAALVVCLVSLAIFSLAAMRAPTLDGMEEELPATDEMVASLREILELGRATPPKASRTEERDRDAA